MLEPVRWIRGLVPVAAVILTSAGGLVRPPALAAADPPWVPPACTDAGPPGGTAGGGAGPWFRTEGVLDAARSLASTRLWVGAIGGAAHRMELPAESFASGPVGSLVVVGADDGERSRVSLVDVARGCARSLPDEASVVRSALLAPDGSALLEHRVDRATREDLGVWRVPLDGSRARRVVAPPPRDWRYGVTFTTELRLLADGRVAVTSCGMEACRTRIATPGRSGETWVGPTGTVIGVAPDGGVIANARCPGSPCAVLRYGKGGDLRLLLAAAGRAAIDGTRLVAETADGLVAVPLRGGAVTRVAGGAGLVPVRDGSLSGRGASHGSSGVLLAPGDRLDPTGARVLPDEAATPLALTEVAR